MGEVRPHNKRGEPVEDQPNFFRVCTKKTSEGKKRHSVPVEWITGTGTVYKRNSKPVTEATGEGPCEEPCEGRYPKPNQRRDDGPGNLRG